MTESFDKTKIAGSIAAGALDEVNNIIKPGVSTSKIDKLCYIHQLQYCFLTSSQKMFFLGLQDPLI